MTECFLRTCTHSPEGFGYTAMKEGLVEFNAFSGKSGQDFSSLLTTTQQSLNELSLDKLEQEFAHVQDIPATERRWSWVEVDLACIRHNVREVKRRLSAGCRLMAVVKADGYGHGAAEVARCALAAGASQLAVATVDEGIALRQAHITAPILVLSEPPQTAVDLLLYYHLMPAVYTSEFAVAYGEAADRRGLRAPYHLAINTGMNRIGVRCEDVLDFIRGISFHRALELEGCFTHFATADSSELLDFNLQLRRFSEVIVALRAAGINPGLVHCDNSAALLRFPKTHMDMARLGISLYGYHPCEETKRSFDLRPAMSVHARITAVNMPPMSEGVGYGLNYRSPGSVKICTIPIGYADGLMRILSGRMAIIYNGRAMAQVGNICMDQCMFEVDLRSHGNLRRLDPAIGDEVLIVGSQNGISQTAEDLALMAQTISYELLCNFGLRMPRLYV